DDSLCGPVDTRPDTDAEIRAFLDRSAGHDLGSHAGAFPPEIDWCAAIDQSRRHGWCSHTLRRRA
ncbi:hypothetical protein, partial [Aeromonas salmonicida]|uniref:hypothetical protein n=1 Tax=Aeromonas salmonicida TaxID=645 RepID=UPI003D31D6C2